MPYQKDIETDFEIKICDHNYWPADIGTHFHNNCYEIYLLQRGSIKYFISGSIYTINDGDIVIIPPSVIHKFRPNIEESHKRTLIHVRQNIIDEFANSDPILREFFGSTQIIRFSEEHNSDIQFILDNILNEYRMGSPLNMLMIKSLVGVLSIALSRRSHSNNNLLAEQDNYVPTRLKQIITYINENYTDEISLNILANKFYLSPVYLSNLFKKYMGLNYSEYLTKIRIKKSTELLSKSKHKIIEVSTMCGFNSSNHFCKTFKNIMGISPLKYRRQKPTV